nr:reverse transcriptase domain-containing protein [Tanacetum cinerariifolium]
MRTRSQSRRRRQQQVPPAVVEPIDLEMPINNQEPPVATMADNRTMAQLLEAPTEGYEEAIVVLDITANNLEIKNGLLNLVQNKQFFGHDKEDTHAHIRYFNKITSTMKFPGVPSTSVKLMLFLFSLKGTARIWLDKEPPQSILTWDDLVSKFVNQFFPPPRRQISGMHASWVANRIRPPGFQAAAANIQAYVSQAVVANFNQGNTNAQLPMDANQIRPPGFPPTQGHTMQNQLTNLTDMLSKFVNANTTSSSGSGTLLSNTVTNPKEDLKGITTRSGAAYQGPTIPSSSFSTPPKVVNSETEDTVLPTNNRANRIDVIDMTYEEYSQEVLGFSNVITSGNPTPNFDLIVSTLSPTLTSFGDGDFFLFEEANSFLALEDDPTSPKVGDSYYDLEGDILLLEEILNSDLSPPPPNQRNYLPEIQKELKICESKTVKSSIDEPSEVELKDLPPHLEYAFLEGDNKLSVIIAKDLKDEEKVALIEVLKSHKQAIAWKLFNIKVVDPEFCTHKILMEEDYKPTVQHQRRVNPKIHDVIKKEVEKLLDARLIYPISDSPWVSPVHCVPKKGGTTIVKNDDNDLIPTRLVMGWRVCIDYRNLNEATRKDHFRLPFMDQMLERLTGKQYYYFLDGFLGYFQIPIDPKDQEKTTFTFPYGTFAYRRMPFGLCNAPGTFQRCMMAIFHDMIEKTMEVFMDDFSVFEDSFYTCLSHLEKMLKWCEDTNLSLNWEKSHFMVKEGIVLGHKISKSGIKVDRAKVEVIAKLP